MVAALSYAPGAYSALGMSPTIRAASLSKYGS